MSYKEWREVISSRTEICFDRSLRLLCEIDDTELSSLSSYGEFESFEIHIISIEGGELRDTQSRRVDTFTDRIVTLSLDRLTGNRREESFDLFAREKCHFSISDPHEIERRRIETCDLFLFQVLQPGSDRDDMSIHGLH